MHSPEHSLQKKLSIEPRRVKRLAHRAMAALAAIGMTLSPVVADTARTQSSEPVLQTPTQEDEQDLRITVSTVRDLQVAIHYNTNINLDTASPEYEAMVAFVERAAQTGMILNFTGEGGIVVPELLVSEEALALKKNVAVTNDSDCLRDVPLDQQPEKLRALIESGVVTLAGITNVGAGTDRWIIITTIKLNSTNFESVRSASNKRPDLFRNEHMHGTYVAALVAESVDPNQTSLICSAIPQLKDFRIFLDQMQRQHGPETIMVTQSIAINSEIAHNFSETLHDESSVSASDEPQLRTLFFNSAGNSGEIYKGTDFGEIVGVSGFWEPAVPGQVAIMDLSSMVPVILDGKRYVFAAQGTQVMGDNIVTGTSIASPELMGQVLKIVQSLSPEQKEAYDAFIQTGATRPQQVAYLMQNFGGQETPMWFLTSGAITGRYQLETEKAQQLLDRLAPTTKTLVSAVFELQSNGITSRDYDIWEAQIAPEVLSPILQLPTVQTAQASLHRVLRSTIDVTVTFLFADGSVSIVDASRATIARQKLAQESQTIGYDPLLEVIAEDVVYELFTILSIDPLDKTYFPVVAYNATISPSE